MKRSISIFLTVLMLLSLLTGCGGTSSEPDPNLGVYKLSEVMGYSLAEFAELVEMTEDETAEMIQIELKANNKVTVIFDGESEDGTWSLDGENLTLNDNGTTIEGTLKDGVMAIEIDGESLTLTKAQ